MAKPFQETVNIQPQTVSTGQPQLLMSLSEKLDNFSAGRAQVAAQKTIANATVKGKAAAQQLQPGQKPEFKEQTFIGGIAKSAYNSALRSSYVASVDRDLSMGLNALKVEHSSDLVSFNEHAKALIAGTVKGIDPASREMVMGTADSFMDSAQIQVQKATIERQMDESDEALLLSGQFYGEEANVHAFNGDDLSSQEALVKTVTANNARVEANKISPAQAAILNDEAFHNARLAKNRGELNQALQLDNGIEVASNAIQQMIEKPLKNMSIEQNDELVSILNSDLNQFISLQNKQEVADQATLTQRQNNNYAQLLVDMATGTANQSFFNTAAKNGDISGTQFNTLTQKLSSQGVGVTDASLSLDIQMAIIGGGDVMDTIVNNMGTNLTMFDGGELLKMQMEYDKDESVLGDSATKRARSYMTDSMKITGIMGTLTDDASKKTASAIREFDERVLDGEDPWAVSDDLYDRDTLIQLESNAGVQGHQTDNISAAINQLNLDTGTASVSAKGNDVELENIKRRYNQQYELLTNIQRLQQNQNAYDKSQKALR